MSALTPAREAATAMVRALQDDVCARVRDLEEHAVFAVDDWVGNRSGGIAGRGSTRVLEGGRTFERAGVNTSIVTGSALPPSVTVQRPELAGDGFFAAGVSAVFHPANPNVPSAHCNVRYFETTGADGAPHGWWFGGGADLTPFYPRLEDVRHFHEVLAGACDGYDERLYPVFKAWCDRYFFLRHRNETRGVGGVFFDYLDGEGFGESDARSAFEHPRSFEELLAFARDLGGAFCEAYFPIVRKRRHEPFGDRERTFQLLRRGRYVEFNLLYDRGTAFGLQSGGRTESILVSLPPLVSWEYEREPARGTREAELQAYLSPRDWFAEDPFAS